MRFDDINSKMDWEKFLKLKIILEKYNIKSILGVIPICKDQNLLVSKEYPNYYDYLRKCKSFGDNIAQHGYEHLYDSTNKGIYGSTKNSEFAGHPLNKQIRKLSKGKSILNKESIWEPIFMAPSHSFDFNTLIALRKLNFNIVLDGFSISPFKKEKIIFIPQISSRPLPLNFPGVFQLCIHVNTISDKELDNLISFIEVNHKKFTALNKLKLKNKLLQLFDEYLMFFVINLFRSIRKNIQKFFLIFKKFRCLYQRLIYKIKFRNLDLYSWHLSGTYFCRVYKKVVLDIINNLEPSFYIDIGCGLGEILARVNLDSNFKVGYDIDNKLEKAIEIINKENFKFFSNESKMINYAKKFKNKQNKKLVISVLNFSHTLKADELNKIINKYHSNLGKYILIIDNIFIKQKEYKYDHHNILYNHEGLIKYWHKVDKLRSLYCIQIG